MIYKDTNMKDCKIEYITPTSEDFKFLYGNETGIWINDEFIEDSNYAIKVEYLKEEDIIKRFGKLISPKQLKNYGRNRM